MQADRFISADSHVLEPGDLWTRGCPAALAERVPRVVQRDGRSFLIGEDLAYYPLSMGFAAGKRGDEFQNRAAQWDDRPAAGYDAAARIEAIEQDGVFGEILYPTIGLSLYQIRDPQLQDEVFDAYNRWLATLIAAGDSRFVGIGMLSVRDPAQAVRKLEEMRSLDLRGALIPVMPPTPYNDPVYEALWEAAAGLEMPLSLHIGTGTGLIRAQGPGAAGMNFVQLVIDQQVSCQAIIWSGALERHPKLHVSFVEGGIGWVAPLLQLMDDKWEQHRGWIKPSLAEPPSAYFSRQCSATFERDKAGLLSRSITGVEPLMWATDYPHAESSWPKSRETAQSVFTEADALQDVEAIVHGNVERLYSWTPQGHTAA